MSILSPNDTALILFGMSGAGPVFFRGWWWTLLTAGWLAGNLIHILFNMMGVRNLGPSTVDIIGPSRTVIIYIVAGACGFLLSSAAGYYGATFRLRSCTARIRTVGASASISRTARCAHALWPQERQQPDPRTGQAVPRSSAS